MNRIERLRALARDAKAMLDMAVYCISNGRRDEALLHAEKAQNTLGKLLIAELGQEVGAVESVWMFRLAGSQEKWAPFFSEQHRLNTMRAPLWEVREFTSPAHTSEARDAARYRWLRDQNSITESPDAWTITRCDFADIEDPSRYWVGTDLDAAIDAAMRQEAE